MANNFQNISIPFNIISIYRAELMGCAIFGVLWGHLMNETWQPVIFSQIARLIHTAGFIFLSGFGLYYAFRKNSNIKHFYTRRLTRILIPFILLTYWFFIVAFAYGEDSPIKFITNLTATSFWFYGESGSWAMWYVSATILLYILFPALFYILFANNKPVLGLFYICIFYIVALSVLAYFCPLYWQNTRIFFARFIMFPLGMFAGYLSANARQASLGQICLYFIGCFILAFAAKLWIDDEIYSVLRTLIGLPVIAIILHCINKWNWTKIIIFTPLKFLGVYSYELYLMHVMIFYLCQRIIGLSSAISMSIGIALALLLCVPVQRLINLLQNKLQHD